MFKVSKGLCLQTVKGCFNLETKYLKILRQSSQFHIPPERTVFNGTDSIKFIGHKIWDLIPNEMKELESLQ